MKTTELDLGNSKVQGYIGFVVCQLNLGYSMDEIKQRHPDLLRYIEEVDKAIREAREDERKEQNKMYAIQQFTGMHASEGRDIRAVCMSMALTKKEWKEIKSECEWLNEEEIREIEDCITNSH